MTERPAFAQPVRAFAMVKGREGMTALRAADIRLQSLPALPRLTANRGERPLAAAQSIAPLAAVDKVGGTFGGRSAAAPASALSFLVSTLAHAVVVTAAIYGGWKVMPLAEVTVDAAQLTLLSEAQFQAMTAPQPEAAMAAAALAMATPATEPGVVVPLDQKEDAPPMAAPAPVVVPLADAPPMATDQSEPLSEPFAEQKPELKPAPKPAPKAAPKRAVQPAQDKPAKKPAAKPEKPAAKKDPAAKPKPAAKAELGGQDSAAKAGKAGSAKQANLSNSETKALKSGWGSKVRNRIERHKKTPKTGKGLEGTVKLRISVAASGALQGVSVIGSSGHGELDKAALQAVKAAAPFPAAPKGLSDASYSFTLPIRFDG